jgi:hypothetical protein
MYRRSLIFGFVASRLGKTAEKVWSGEAWRASSIELAAQQMLDESNPPLSIAPTGVGDGRRFEIALKKTSRKPSAYSSSERSRKSGTLSRDQ